ncbi:hypothetical protein AEAC466_07715 [Asticcacaulis sp. AC466]|uniref:hypothetical protein n=1 Tax=Asticcacaulis sp. AC466 TaxID=1282362 RepID=UPI0003C3E452|nr:hypothetical protein [Asticcacaulis sp. AC466]ESQ84935.1 hypothetical protein AEAC466_07715 [Asticcacaulis sp. AC466]
MSKLYHPDQQNYLSISYDELDMVLKMLADPQKSHHVSETINTVRTINMQVGTEKAIYTLVSAIAWLTDERVGLLDG